LGNLERKVAIVTGSGSGIGRAAAALLARRGAAVAIVDIDADAASAVAAELAADGCRAIAVPTDVEVDSEIQHAVETTVDHFGGLDILHNNAALLDPAVMARDTTILEADGALMERVLRVNVVAYMLAAKYAIPHMIARGGGVIINTSSVSGVQAELVRAMYGTSKTAVIGLTRNMATQYGKQGIRAVAIAPGVIVTPTMRAQAANGFVDAMVRHGLSSRAGEPEDVAELVAFLASDAAGFITGITIPIDGGITAHLPTFAEDLDALGGLGASS
jgi:NAD(P)-dependent dehydrogenase (short-subunit alcohol dehydrogenase family)